MLRRVKQEFHAFGRCPHRRQIQTGHPTDAGNPGDVTLVPELVQDLFSDTRQQQQQMLDAACDASAEQEAMQALKQNFSVATSGLGLATLGTLVAPVFYLPSIVCVFYAFRFFFQDAYQVYREERCLAYRAVWPATSGKQGQWLWPYLCRDVLAFELINPNYQM